MKKLIIIGLLIVLAGCSAPKKSMEVLEKQGFTDIEITGWKMFECGEDDTFSTGFKARNTRGTMVEGTVCCGVIMKGCTIRY